MRARVFVKQPESLIEMLELRLQGWSRYSLARKYETDKTTIRHWCDRTFKITPVVYQGVEAPRQVTVITFTPTESHKKYKYQHLFDEEDVVPHAKTYDQIRVQSRKRQLIRLGIL